MSLSVAGLGYLLFVKARDITGVAEVVHELATNAAMAKSMWNGRMHPAANCVCDGQRQVVRLSLMQC
jgi:hypothetical protein